VRIADSSVTASREVFEMLKYEGRERNMKVEYGEKEAVLMRCLEEQPYVTVDDFARLAKIPRNTASRTLVHLCKANVLRLRPQVDGPDRYKRAID
jgi:Fic family protein